MLFQSSYLMWGKYQEGQGETERREERKEGGGREKEENSVRSGSAISFLLHHMPYLTNC